MQLNPDYLITSEEQLRQHYAQPNKMVRQKQIDHLDDYARRLIASSPFAVIGTVGPAGIDCSPKGGEPGFIRIEDEKTLLLADRPGNNRLDGIRNLLQQPFIGILFLIPGWSEGFRVNGRARVSIDPELCSRFTQNEQPARSVLVITVDEVFIHCGRAISFADLWNSDRQLNQEALPTVMEVVKAHIALSSQNS